MPTQSTESAAGDMAWDLKPTSQSIQPALHYFLVTLLSGYYVNYLHKEQLVPASPATQPLTFVYLVVMTALWARDVTTLYRLPRTREARLSAGIFAAGILVLMQRNRVSDVVNPTGWIRYGAYLLTVALLPWGLVAIEVRTEHWRDGKFLGFEK
ncbi:hypothetical protein PVAG01_10627 [Phlyctema vagabunda]|uniref:Uncharacterized protein n=1 Tax=Phlyctema vagabunda TaxID=108571 RepID=A0ABR4P2T2_9HELO